MMKRILITVILIYGFSCLFGQQQPVISQYMLNKYLINPAVAGSATDFMRVTSGFPVSVSYRKLWAGVEDAPSMQYLTGHLEVANRMGVGAQVFNINSGPLSRTGFTATYAYHIPLNDKGDRLAFGLSGIIYQFKIDRANLELENPDDPALLGSEKILVPDAAFGTYYYRDNYYVGLTVSQMFNRKINLLESEVFEQKQVRHYYLTGGYRFEINSDFTLEPSVLLKLIEAGVFQGDINLLFSYKNTVWAGTSFRPLSSLVFLAGFKYDKFSIGYSFDMSFTDIRIQSYGSHEVFLMYNFSNFITK
jgi:type IX secretion system PorP/SprF family membrane protein